MRTHIYHTQERNNAQDLVQENHDPVKVLRYVHIGPHLEHRGVRI